MKLITSTVDRTSGFRSLALTLVLAESAIELVPNQIAGHPAIIGTAKKKGKNPHRLILDRSYHHSAILRLGPSGTGRGRPDIAHLSLLTALGSPLNIDGALRCFVHTRNDHIITVDPRARLPRNTDRFTSLLEKLYEDSVVPPSGRPLMSLKQQPLSAFLDEQSPDLVVALTTKGSPKTMDRVAEELRQAQKPILIVGGFPTGHFSPATTKVASGIYRVDSRRLEAWTIVGRAIYDYERVIGLRRF